MEPRHVCTPMPIGFADAPGLEPLARAGPLDVRHHDRRSALLETADALCGRGRRTDAPDAVDGLQRCCQQLRQGAVVVHDQDCRPCAPRPAVHAVRAHLFHVRPTTPRKSVALLDASACSGFVWWAGTEVLLRWQERKHRDADPAEEGARDVHVRRRLEGTADESSDRVGDQDGDGAEYELAGSRTEQRAAGEAADHHATDHKSDAADGQRDLETRNSE